MKPSPAFQDKLFEASEKRIARFGLSRRKHLPCIWVGDIYNFPPYRIDVFLKFRGLKCAKTSDGNIELSKSGLRFVLAPEYASLFINEFADWDKQYNPPFSPTNKTIMDVGAGCGETIFYFALKGCKDFIAIEPNPQNADLIRLNASRNSLNVKIYTDIFRRCHLDEHFDFMKSDCEGGESILLEPEKCKPVSLEVHGKDLKQKFLKKGFKIAKDFKNGSCIMRNY